MYRTTWIITVSAIPFSYTESHVPHDNANKLFSYMSKVSNIVFISITTLPVKALFSKLCTFLLTRSGCGCGADPGRWPLTAAARGCTFLLWRIRPRDGRGSTRAHLQQRIEFYQFSFKCFNSLILEYKETITEQYTWSESLPKHLYSIVLTFLYNWHYFTVKKIMQFANHTLVQILNSEIIKSDM